MPTGTKIAAIVLVVLLGAAGLYYAFFPSAPAPKIDPPKGSSTLSSASSGIGLGSGSNLADPLSRPSTLPPAGASSNSSNTTGLAAGTVPGATSGVPGTATATGTTSTGVTGGSTAPAGALAGNTNPSTDSNTATTTGSRSLGFKNGPGNLATPGLPNNSTGTGANPTGSSSTLGAANSGTPTSTIATGASSSINGTNNGTGSATTTSPSSSNSESTYVVKKGDTFETIAKSVYGSTSKWREIAKANPTVEATRLKIGAKLRIPAAGASISSENTVASATPKSNPTAASGSRSTSKSTTAAAVSSGTHVVAKGDTFSSLARSYYGDSKFWKFIAKANPKISEKSLAVGTKLAIPPKSAVVSGGNIER